MKTPFFPCLLRFSLAVAWSASSSPAGMAVNASHSTLPSSANPSGSAGSSATCDLRVVAEVSAGQPLGQCRVVPLTLGPGRPKALLAVFAEDAVVDPYEEMFFFPKDTLHLMAFTEKGETLWARDLGRGVVPGIWFCPVFPFDLDGDGVDEIWFVNNADSDHPLTLAKR